MNMDFIRKLEIPMELKKQFPLKKEFQEIILKRNEEFKNILCGKINKKVLIIGPCSADSEDSVVDYCKQIKKIYDEVKNKLFIIPRVFTSKPRTDGNDYKGLLHQPDPQCEEDMWNGIIKVRKIHMRVLEETNMNCADELLYVQNYKYVDDLLCYVTIGSRSSDNQEHKLTASGIEVPVGIKNPMNGNLCNLLNSVHTAQNPHMFIYRGWEVKSKGNPYAHVILRGYVNENGDNISNYNYEKLIEFINIYDNYNLQNKSIIIDCNHSNSNKDYLKQVDVINDVICSMNKNKNIYNYVKGFMIESYIEDGKQDINGNIYGKSITDSCLGIEKTKKLIYEIYNKI